MGNSRKYHDMMESGFKGCINGTIDRKPLFFQVVFTPYQGERKDAPRGKNRFYFIEELFGVKSVELGIFRVWEVHNDSVVRCGCLFYKESTVAHMNPHKRMGKTAVKAHVQVKNGGIEFNIVYSPGFVFGYFQDGSKDPSADQKNIGSLSNLTEGKMGHSLHVKVMGGKQRDRILKDV
jgi:hypothetical protein